LDEGPEAHKSVITELALRYAIVTPFTSFVAVAEGDHAIEKSMQHVLIDHDTIASRMADNDCTPLLTGFGCWIDLILYHSLIWFVDLCKLVAQTESLERTPRFFIHYSFHLPTKRLCYWQVGFSLAICLSCLLQNKQSVNEVCWRHWDRWCSVIHLLYVVAFALPLLLQAGILLSAFF